MTQGGTAPRQCSAGGARPLDVQSGRGEWSRWSPAPPTGDLARAVHDTIEAMSEGRLVHDVRRATNTELTREILREIDDPVNYLLNSLNPLRDAAETLLRIAQLYEEMGTRPQEERDEHLRSIEALKEELRYGEVQQSLDLALRLIESGANRAHQAAQELWRVNVSERGLYRLMDVRQALDRAIAKVESSTAKEVVFERHYRSIPLIPALRAEIQELLRHLLTNAVEAVDDGGHVDVQVSLKHGHVVIRLGDDGCGIPGEDLPRIFEPFFSRKTGSRAAGLGLVVCRAIVVDHNGTIEARSCRGEGSEFVVRLPIVQSSEEQRLAVACHRRRQDREHATPTGRIRRCGTGS